MTQVNLLPLLAGSIGSISVFIQAYKIYLSKLTRDISLISYLLLILSSCIWIIYGIYKKDNYLIIGSSIILIPSIFIVYYKIKKIIIKKDTFINFT